jgi:DUF971 family protein
MTARVTAVRAPHGSPWFEADFSDGYRARLPNWVLRGYCPCALCQGHGSEVQFQPGRDSELRELTPVGRYALAFTWGDLHASGIYTFAYLRRLSEAYAEHGDTMPSALPVLTR